MASRQSHIPLVKQRKSSAQAVSSVNSAAGRTGRQSNQFASGIMGKYGFWRNNYLGLLALIFRQNGLLSDDELSSLAGSNEKEWVIQLQLQLQSLQHPDSAPLASKRETIHRLEQWIKRYGQMLPQTGPIGPISSTVQLKERPAAVQVKESSEQEQEQEQPVKKKGRKSKKNSKTAKPEETTTLMHSGHASRLEWRVQQLNEGQREHQELQPERKRQKLRDRHQDQQGLTNGLGVLKWSSTPNENKASSPLIQRALGQLSAAVRMISRQNSDKEQAARLPLVSPINHRRLTSLISKHTHVIRHVESIRSTSKRLEQFQDGKEGMNDLSVSMASVNALPSLTDAVETILAGKRELKLFADRGRRAEVRASTQASVFKLGEGPFTTTSVPAAVRFIESLLMRSAKNNELASVTSEAGVQDFPRMELAHRRNNEDTSDAGVKAALPNSKPNENSSSVAKGYLTAATIPNAIQASSLTSSIPFAMRSVAGTNRRLAHRNPAQDRFLPQKESDRLQFVSKMDSAEHSIGSSREIVQSSRLQQVAFGVRIARQAAQQTAEQGFSSLFAQKNAGHNKENDPRQASMNTMVSSMAEAQHPMDSLRAVAELAPKNTLFRRVSRIHSNEGALDQLFNGRRPQKKSAESIATTPMTITLWKSISTRKSESLNSDRSFPGRRKASAFDVSNDRKEQVEGSIAPFTKVLTSADATSEGSVRRSLGANGTSGLHARARSITSVGSDTFGSARMIAVRSDRTNAGNNGNVGASTGASGSGSGSASAKTSADTNSNINARIHASLKATAGLGGINSSASSSAVARLSASSRGNVDATNANVSSGSNVFTRNSASSSVVARLSTNARTNAGRSSDAIASNYLNASTIDHPSAYVGNSGIAGENDDASINSHAKINARASTNASTSASASTSTSTSTSTSANANVNADVNVSKASSISSNSSDAPTSPNVSSSSSSHANGSASDSAILSHTANEFTKTKLTGQPGSNVIEQQGVQRSVQSASRVYPNLTPQGFVWAAARKLLTLKDPTVLWGNRHSESYADRGASSGLVNRSVSLNVNFITNKTLPSATKAGIKASLDMQGHRILRKPFTTANGKRFEHRLLSDEGSVSSSRSFLEQTNLASELAAKITRNSLQRVGTSLASGAGELQLQQAPEGPAVSGTSPTDTVWREPARNHGVEAEGESSSRAPLSDVVQRRAQATEQVQQPVSLQATANVSAPGPDRTGRSGTRALEHQRAREVRPAAASSAARAGTGAAASRAPMARQPVRMTPRVMPLLASGAGALRAAPAGPAAASPAAAAKILPAREPGSRILAAAFGSAAGLASSLNWAAAVTAKPLPTQVQRQVTSGVPSMGTPRHSAPMLGAQATRLLPKDGSSIASSAAQQALLLMDAARPSAQPVSHMMLEHKQAPAPEASALAETPLDMDWLRTLRSDDSAQPVAAPAEQAAPQLDMEQLQELVKKLPQLDVGKIADKVYREIEKKMKFERQRRGL
ncbi:hypothetical protein [Paenibacillus sp. SI8]|uniref:hypothetical protein n=1 Tax=unclassified Paenibacillus TaxID=185978 RepID=UPI00346684EB